MSTLCISEIAMCSGQALKMVNKYVNEQTTLRSSLIM